MSRSKSASQLPYEYKQKVQKYLRRYAMVVEKEQRRLTRTVQKYWRPHGATKASR